MFRLLLAELFGLLSEGEPLSAVSFDDEQLAAPIDNRALPVFTK